MTTLILSMPLFIVTLLVLVGPLCESINYIISEISYSLFRFTRD